MAITQTFPVNPGLLPSLITFYQLLTAFRGPFLGHYVDPKDITSQ